MRQSDDLIQYTLDFQAIIVRRANHAHCVVEAIDIGDFRGVKIIHASARWTVDPVIRRVLVRPSGMTAVGLHHLEDGIRVNRVVWIKRRTLAVCILIARQCRWIDHILRDIVGIVQVYRLVEDHRIAWLSGAICVCRVINVSRVAHIV